MENKFSKLKRQSICLVTMLFPEKIWGNKIHWVIISILNSCIEMSENNAMTSDIKHGSAIVIKLVLLFII